LNPDATSTLPRTVLADFQRWLLVIAFAAAVASALLHALPFWPNDLRAILSIATIWASLGALEAWLLPLRGVTRIGWIVTAAWSGAAILFYSDLRGAFSGWPWVLSGLFEAGLCRRTRRHAWVWLPATPLIYATLDEWSDVFSKPVNWFFAQFDSLAPKLPGFFEMFGTTTVCVFLLLLVRAGLACFLCRPRGMVAGLVPGGRIELPTKGL
jgi:hypothetical protein